MILYIRPPFKSYNHAMMNAWSTSWSGKFVQNTNLVIIHRRQLIHTVIDNLRACYQLKYTACSHRGKPCGSVTPCI